MGAIYFYHLTRNPAEITLASLLDKSLQAGWRVVVRGRDTQQLDYFDAKLWDGAPDSFRAHGIAGGEHDADQPILLTTSDTIANDAACLMVVGGAEIAPDEANNFERVCVLFDGNDDGALKQARTQWKTVKDAGVSAQYWSEESGRWEMKSET